MRVVVVAPAAISHVVGFGGGGHKALTRRIVATYIQHTTNTIDERKIRVPPIAKFLMCSSSIGNAAALSSPGSIVAASISILIKYI